MKSNISFTCTVVLCLLAFVFQTFAGAEVMEIQPEEVVATEPAVDARSVREMIDEYLQAKGWTEGRNEKDGKVFYAAVGIGVVQAPIENRGYIDSRMNAYNKAMLDAKSQMSQFLATEIATETLHLYMEGNPEGDDSKAESEMDLYEKVRRLLVAKLDKELRKEGIDPDMENREKLERAAKKQLNSDSFQRSVSVASKAEITGMQVCCSFEGVRKGRKGEIGVVAIWSAKLQVMAESIKTGRPVPGTKGKLPISKQISADAKTLMSTFGVQQKIDEKGDLVLVAFGQSGTVNDSAQSATAAENKARLQAVAALREFAGEVVCVEEDCLNSESVEEYEQAATSYENSSAFRQRIQSVSAGLNISGIMTVKRWNTVHPISGHPVYGAVVSWCPRQAREANAMKGFMEGTSSVPIVVEPPSQAKAPIGTDSDEELSNVGIDSDVEAF